MTHFSCLLQQCILWKVKGLFQQIKKIRCLSIYFEWIVVVEIKLLHVFLLKELQLHERCSNKSPTLSLLWELWKLLCKLRALTIWLVSLKCQRSGNLGITGGNQRAESHGLPLWLTPCMGQVYTLTGSSWWAGKWSAVRLEVC